MFFTLSKLFWLVADPLNLIGILLALSIALAIFRWRRLALAGMATALLIFAVGALSTAGALMLHPLEDRFARPDPVPDDIAGIVVLGGGMDGRVNRVRGGYELGAAGDRLVETAVLARRYPQARILVSGGSGALFIDAEGDGDAAPRLLEALGVEAGRIIGETRSRNTHENALFSRELADPQAGETWLLVTSAFHMPRSVGLFRQAGFDVVPWPSDYRTTGTERIGLSAQAPLDTMGNFSTALREWIGLFAYRLTGRLDRIMPEAG